MHTLSYKMQKIMHDPKSLTPTAANNLVFTASYKNHIKGLKESTVETK